MQAIEALSILILYPVLPLHCLGAAQAIGIPIGKLAHLRIQLMIQSGILVVDLRLGGSGLVVAMGLDERVLSVQTLLLRRSYLELDHVWLGTIVDRLIGILILVFGSVFDVLDYGG